MTKEIFIDYRRTLGKITKFRHMTESEQYDLIQEIRHNTEQLINELLLIHDRDKQQNHTEVAS